MGARTNRAGRVVWQAVTPAGNGSAWRFDNTGPAGAGAGYILGNTGAASNVVIPNNTPAGAPYGTALVAEADPVNLADVPANRRIPLIPIRTGIPLSSGAITVRTYGYGAAAGNFTISYWIYESFAARWIGFGTVNAAFTSATAYLIMTQLAITYNFYSALCAVTINANVAGAPYLAVSMH